ncbi:MAG: roadblock/LC7 domain-containing protein [Candidatus Heimdallarchaeota archaeon]|nr:roadblock/LC7 domain-containing protein [Candidatus Heimdallarchaeota archaeon]
MFDFTFSERTNDMKNILDEIDLNVRQIQAAAVVSVEGLPIASKLPDKYEDTIIAAMTAAMLSLGDKIASNLDKGQLERIMIEGSNGVVVSMAAGPNAVLTVSAEKDAPLGLLFMEMSTGAKKIAELLV